MLLFDTNGKVEASSTQVHQWPDFDTRFWPLYGQYTFLSKLATPYKKEKRKRKKGVSLIGICDVCERDSIISHNIAYNVRVGKLVWSSIFFIMRFRTI